MSFPVRWPRLWRHIVTTVNNGRRFVRREIYMIYGPICSKVWWNLLGDYKYIQYQVHVAYTDEFSAFLLDMRSNYMSMWSSGYEIYAFVKLWIRDLWVFEALDMRSMEEFVKLWIRDLCDFEPLDTRSMNLWSFGYEIYEQVYGWSQEFVKLWYESNIFVKSTQQAVKSPNCGLYGLQNHGIY